MNGANFQRIIRVARNVCAHPEYLMEYLRNLPLTGRLPLDAEIPWFSFGAIDYLESHLPPDSVVFEWGGGGSTLFWAKRAKHVITVESSDEWADRLTQVLSVKGITNVTVLRHPFDPSDKAGFEDSVYLNCVDDYKANVFVVDGYEADVQLRPICFSRAEDRVEKGGIIIVDDSWRYIALRSDNRAQKHLVFETVGPCRYGITSTDIFFY